MLSRTYHEASGGGSIEAQLMTGGSLMQGLASMFMNPQLLAAQPNAKRIRVGREAAVVTYNPDDKSGQLVLSLGGKVSIMLQGHDLADSDPHGGADQQMGPEEGQGDGRRLTVTAAQAPAGAGGACAGPGAAETPAGACGG